MKRTFFIVFLGIFLCANSAFAFSSPIHKFVTGVKQIVTAPFSLITVPAEQYKNSGSDKALGFIGGLMEGVAQTAFQPIQGVFNILTFPFTDY